MFGKLLTSPLWLHHKLKALFAMRHGKTAVTLFGMILGFPIALFAPLDVLTAYPWLAEFVDFFDRHLGIVSEMSLPTRFPEVAKLYYAFQFFLLPLWVYVFCLIPMERAMPLKRIKENRFQAPLWAVVGFIVVFLIVLFGSGDPHRPIRGIFALTQHSRFALGLLGHSIGFGLIVCPYLIAVCIIRFREIYLKQETA